MRFLKFYILFFALLVAAGCTSRYRLESAVDKEIGKAQLVEKTRLELDKLLGKEDSVLKESVLNLVSDRVKIEYDTIIDGKRARVNVRAEIPKMSELNTVLLLASFLPRDRMLKMTVDDLLAEISRSSRRPASLEDIRTEVYEFKVDFEKNKSWIVNAEQLKKAYSRKNLISRK